MKPFLFCPSLLLLISCASAPIVSLPPYATQARSETLAGMERTQLVMDTERGEVLKVYYPRGQAGVEKSGVTWVQSLPQSYERLQISYWVKFADGFDFHRGGKLPGLCGGAAKGFPDWPAGGGYSPDGTDTWSARMMWRPKGLAVQYLYHKNKPGKWGHDLSFERRFIPGKWHHLRNEIVMNEVGKRNGILRAWMDGELVLEKKDIEYRTVPELKIDCLYFTTYFGGFDITMAAQKDEYLLFDDVKVFR